MENSMWKACLLQSSELDAVYKLVQPPEVQNRMPTFLLWNQEIWRIDSSVPLWKNEHTIPPEFVSSEVLGVGEAENTPYLLSLYLQRCWGWGSYTNLFADALKLPGGKKNVFIGETYDWWAWLRNASCESLLFPLQNWSYLVLQSREWLPAGTRGAKRHHTMGRFSKTVVQIVTVQNSYTCISPQWSRKGTHSRLLAPIVITSLGWRPASISLLNTFLSSLCYSQQKTDLCNPYPWGVSEGTNSSGWGCALCPEVLGHSASVRLPSELMTASSCPSHPSPGVLDYSDCYCNNYASGKWQVIHPNSGYHTPFINKYTLLELQNNSNKLYTNNRNYEHKNARTSYTKLTQKWLDF